MSLADTLIVLTAAAHNVIHADEWTILGVADGEGTKFTGEAQTEPVLTLETDLGTDGREKTTLCIDRPAPRLERGVKVQCGDKVWTVIGDRDDNPFNARVKYEIQLQSPVDS